MSLDQNKVHPNLFNGGLDADTAFPNLSNLKYFQANNVNLVGDSKFSVLQNIKGTTKLSDITDVVDTNVLAIFETNYKTGSTTSIPCLTIFTATLAGTFNIYSLNLQSNTLYKIYQESTNLNYHTSDRLIDGIVYSERGYDIIYFTDNYNEVRKLKCIIPTVYTDNFLLKDELSLFKKRALGNITLTNVTTGGTLLTGTYQLAYQLVNPDKNQYTNFSLLTNPIHVYTTLSNGITCAGVGLPSNKKITITITPTEDELALYTHFRLAIVENTNPEGVVNLAIDMTKIEKISDFPGLVYDIKSNANFDTTNIDDITIDLAAIDTCKTLTIAQNRLIIGNIKLKNLQYDREPTISGGSLIRQSGSNDSFSSDLFTSRFKGLFRDEVYRYAVSYFDNYGNFSYPKQIDLSTITDNQITSGLKDLKTPKRWQAGGVYTVMDATDNTQSIGLRINNLNNHPSWAKGFIILRAKRKKNILFQSPFLPMSSVYGPGAVEKYPTKYTNADGNEITVTDAKPMGPNTVYTAPNLFSGGFCNFIKNETIDTTDIFTDTVGETKQVFGSTDMWMCFPDSVMYTANSKIELTNTEKINTVDSSTCRFYLSRFDAFTRTSGVTNVGTSYNYFNGGSEDSSISGSFFASRNNDYYYNYGNSKGISLENFRSNILDFGSITGNKSFDNFSEGSQINGKNVFTFDKLTTTGLQLGFKPNTQRSMVINTSKKAFDLTSSIIPTYINVNYSSGTPDIGYFLFGTRIRPENFMVYQNAAFEANGGLYSGLVNKIEIVNIIKNLSDDRYGSTDSFNEFIYTGTKVVFTNAEQVTIKNTGNLPKTIDVWGGDCIVSPHTFKVSDSLYVLANKLDFGTLWYNRKDTSARAFNKSFGWLSPSGLPGDVCVGLPLALKNAAQYLTIVLESEYHGSVRDIDLVDNIGTYNFPIKGSLTEEKLRSPLVYNYNGLEKQNDQKIFVPIDKTQPIISNYKARVMYTDQKVYQTNIVGFDTLRVGNIYDLQEVYGGITKLSFSNNNVYALQEEGIVYIPLAERVLELTNTSQLGVRTGDLFGNYIYLRTNAGCQHSKTVRNTGQALIFADQNNKTVYKLENNSIAELNKGVWSLLKTYLSDGENSEIEENKLIGVYDNLRNQYWLANKNGNYCLIYNETFDTWVSNYTFNFGFSGGLYSNNNLYVIGNNAGKYSLETMYTGNPGQLFGNYANDVSVSFIANPIPTFGKTFDDVLIASSDKLNTIDFITERDTILGNQQCLGMNIDVTSRGEGNYRAKILRDSNNARMRGLFAKVKLNWKTGVGAPLVSVYSVNTKFRPSENLF